MKKKVVFPKDVFLEEVAHLLAEGREVKMVPKGVSMLPFIRGGKDTVVLRKKTPICVGDIVLARFERGYILHRVFAIDGTKVVLMGDGNLQGVEQGDVAEVCGTVVEIISPKGRRRRLTKGKLWRKLLPVRKYLLKIDRKWHKIFDKQVNTK